MSSPPSENEIVHESGAARAFRIGQEVGDVEQEGPTMRSVSMMAPSSALLPPLGGGMLKGPNKVSFSRPSLGISRPPMGLGRPTSMGVKAGLSSDPFLVKQEWTGVASPSSWEVKGEELEMVPLDFPLERTHREIHGATATEVARRISEALRCLSICAEFDCEKAKAKCKTNDFVSFRIRLYAGGEQGVPVVVEVQRRCGPPSSFMRSCRAILDAAEGKQPKVTLSPASRMPQVGQMKCLQSVTSTFSNCDDRIDDALENVMSMLKSKHRDSHVLALENLKALTDPIKTMAPVALKVSRSVALGDDKYDVREEIVELTERDVFGPGFEDEEGTARRHREHVRHLAFSIFANALDVCSNEGCLSDAVSNQRWFTETLIPLLLDEVKIAASNPCIAYEASSCLRSLVSVKKARLVVVECGGENVIAVAHEFGKLRHDLLAEETRRCLSLLSN